MTLYLALIKFDRFEWAVEKATELGVTRIVPVAAVRSERGLFEGGQKRVERWRRIAHEASEQSRRLRVPEIDAPVKMIQAMADDSTHRFWCDERPGAGPAGFFSPSGRRFHSAADWPGRRLDRSGAGAVCGGWMGWRFARSAGFARRNGCLRGARGDCAEMACGGDAAAAAATIESGVINTFYGGPIEYLRPRCWWSRS